MLAALAAAPAAAESKYKGTIELRVDATDIDHQIITVHETIPVQRAGDATLLYPQWELASHAPTASVANLAGLSVRIDGAQAPWRRDPIDMYAFHVHVPPGSRSLVLDFQYLGPLSTRLLRANLAKVAWQSVLMYPAGWDVRHVPVAATLTLPNGLKSFTSLAHREGSDGTSKFETVSLESLVDAPVYAGRFTRSVPLAPGAAKPVALDLLAEDAKNLAISEEEIARMKTLIAETLVLFGPPPYDHYDAIVTLSDVFSPGGGTEHLQEGENNLPADYFLDTAAQLENRDLIAHEFVHAWNGMWRMPADLRSPNFNLPLSGSLLWVYEGQTEFWGRILAARAGLRDRQQTLDKLALDAAIVANQEGRVWKNLRDSSNDAVYMAGHRVVWRDWQRREDYYPEGVMLWLDVDARLRQLTGARHGLDEFAQRFFKVAAAESQRTYTFEDVCATLHSITPDNWSAFLNRHLDSHRSEDALAGLARSGWQLTYTDVASETLRQEERESGTVNLQYSIGLRIDKDGRVQQVRWRGPAFDAGIAPGTRVLEVNGQAYSTAALTDAIRAAAQNPITLKVDTEGESRVIDVAYRGGLRYPHLVRIDGTPDYLSALLEPSSEK